MLVLYVSLFFCAPNALAVSRAWTPVELLHLAQARRVPQLLDILAANPELWKIVGPHGESLLHSAVKGGDYTLFTACIKNNVSLDTLYNNSLTPLMMAVGTRNMDMCVALLDAGADMQRHGSLGVTPLMLAMNYKANAIAEKLLERGGRVLVMDVDKYKHSAAHWAASVGHVSGLLLLRRWGADMLLMGSKGMPVELLFPHLNTMEYKELIHMMTMLTDLLMGNSAWETMLLMISYGSLLKQWTSPKAGLQETIHKLISCACCAVVVVLSISVLVGFAFRMSTTAWLILFLLTYLESGLSKYRGRSTLKSTQGTRRDALWAIWNWALRALQLIGLWWYLPWLRLLQKLRDQAEMYQWMALASSLEDALCLLQVSRPQFWWVTLNAYDMGRRYASEALPYAFFITTWPGNMILYGINDLVDNEEDLVNERKTHTADAKGDMACYHPAKLKKRQSLAWHGVYFANVIMILWAFLYGDAFQMAIVALELLCCWVYSLPALGRVRNIAFLDTMICAGYMGCMLRGLGLWSQLPTDDIEAVSDILSSFRTGMTLMYHGQVLHYCLDYKYDVKNGHGNTLVTYGVAGVGILWSMITLMDVIGCGIFFYFMGGWPWMDHWYISRGGASIMIFDILQGIVLAISAKLFNHIGVLSSTSRARIFDILFEDLKLAHWWYLGNGACCTFSVLLLHQHVFWVLCALNASSMIMIGVLDIYTSTDRLKVKGT
eukprot:TRINITY_DN11372_c0_g1_i2.p1 TRINITY_DN11372_c0_g1~~TRINITY_DN11372_c0_g1_i2.p1  ORF type:complete len:719 (+),score=18.85 TRINITY_DN11372_c0_g1_i2:25-2181(+)